MHIIIGIVSQKIYIFGNLFLQLFVLFYTLALLRTTKKLHSFEGYCSFIMLITVFFELLAWTQVLQPFAILKIREYLWYYHLRNAYWTVYWLAWTKNALQYIQWRLAQLPASTSTP